MKKVIFLVLLSMGCASKRYTATSNLGVETRYNYHKRSIQSKRTKRYIAWCAKQRKKKMKKAFKKFNKTKR